MILGRLRLFPDLPWNAGQICHAGCGIQGLEKVERKRTRANLPSESCGVEMKTALSFYTLDQCSLSDTCVLGRIILSRSY